MIEAKALMYVLAFVCNRQSSAISNASDSPIYADAHKQPSPFNSIRTTSFHRLFSSLFLSKLYAHQHLWKMDLNYYTTMHITLARDIRRRRLCCAIYAFENASRCLSILFATRFCACACLCLRHGPPRRRRCNNNSNNSVGAATPSCCLPHLFPFWKKCGSIKHVFGVVMHFALICGSFAVSDWKYLEAVEYISEDDIIYPVDFQHFSPFFSPIEKSRNSNSPTHTQPTDPLCK